MLGAVSLLIFEALLIFSKIEMSKISNESKHTFRGIIAEVPMESRFVSSSRKFIGFIKKIFFKVRD